MGSDSVSQDHKFLRQLDIADPSKFRYPVTILGVGSIGSSAAIALAKMGTPKGITLIDFDYFEKHNVSNQLCLATTHLGMTKVNAIRDLCREMGHDGPITAFPHKLEGDKLTRADTEIDLDAKPFFKGVVLNLPDSMKVRKEVWGLCKYNMDTPYVIDARMAGEYLVVYVANTMLSKSIKSYESSLYDDESASQEPCGARSIIYTSFIAGGIIASFVKRLQLGQDVPSSVHLDITKLEVTQTLSNGSIVSNRDAIALATAE